MTRQQTSDHDPALERIVDRLMLSLATKAELREAVRELKADIRDLRVGYEQLIQDVAALKAEMRMLKWMFALGGSTVIGLMSAVLVVLLTRL